MKAVRIEGLTKRFGDVVALDNINLEIEEGEIYGFLGPNITWKKSKLYVQKYR